MGPGWQTVMSNQVLLEETGLVLASSSTIWHKTEGPTDKQSNARHIGNASWIVAQERVLHVVIKRGDNLLECPLLMPKILSVFHVYTPRTSPLSQSLKSALLFLNNLFLKLFVYLFCGCTGSHCGGLWVSMWLLLLQGSGSRHVGFSSCGIPA